MTSWRLCWLPGNLTVMMMMSHEKVISASQELISQFCLDLRFSLNQTTNWPDTGCCWYFACSPSPPALCLMDIYGSAIDYSSILTSARKWKKHIFYNVRLSLWKLVFKSKLFSAPLKKKKKTPLTITKVRKTNQCVLFIKFIALLIWIMRNMHLCGLIDSAWISQVNICLSEIQ